MEIHSSNEEAFRKVYGEVFPIVMKVAYHVTYNMDAAEDICQEAFFRFFDKNMDFATIDDAKYWLIRVTKNLAINYVKRKAREQASYEKIKKMPVSASPRDGGAELVLKETRELVRQAIEDLPEKFRTVIVLKEYADMDYKSIGKVLQISESNVKVRVHRARKMMEQALDREEVHVS